MSDTTKQPDQTTAQIISLPKAAAANTDKTRFEKKWSKAVTKHGYTMLPSLLLRGQAKLGITANELNVLLQIIEHWWEPENDPYPAKDAIARRMGITGRQVQRILKQLEVKKLIKRQARFHGLKNQTSNSYSFAGLAEKLKLIEPEFAKAVEQTRIRRKKLETARGGGA